MATVRVLHPKLLEDYYAAEEGSVEQINARKRIVEVFTEGTDLTIDILAERTLRYKTLPDGGQVLSITDPTLITITKEVLYVHRK